MNDQTTRSLGHWIDGDWRDPVDGVWRENLSPIDQRFAGRFAVASIEDADSAVASARQAFEQNRDAKPSDREAWLLAAADGLQNSADEVVDALIVDTGSPISKAQREVATSIGVLRAAAGACRRILGQTLPSDVPGRWSFAVRRPLGVVAGITPFNVPLIKAVKHSALPLATGNAVVMLPSPQAPHMAAMLAKIYQDAGVPRGLFNVVFGDGDVVGDALTIHPDVQMVGFTGSTTVGRRVATRAAADGKRVTLEMGGKNPAVVCGDADLQSAAPMIAMGGFLFQGQICMSTSWVLAHESVHRKLCERLVNVATRLPDGDLRDPATVIGPMISDRQCERVQRLVDDAVHRGARVMCGGGHSGRTFQPTVLADVDDSMDVMKQEIFGPVICIQAFTELQDAIDRINDRRFALCAAIHTDSLGDARMFAKQCGSAMVHINGPTVQEEAHVPFGGNKDSGFGREGALVGIDELTTWQWVTAN
ncbi:aldehyde dehydrogenase family protein [Crateriforma spongiae]|uniref:aldehyde dehydrogenase family protein n=1 Tax=Crateriforma spongiae TaxID=2724528 RepID=UPI0039AFC6A1